MKTSHDRVAPILKSLKYKKSKKYYTNFLQFLYFRNKIPIFVPLDVPIFTFFKSGIFESWIEIPTPFPLKALHQVAKIPGISICQCSGKYIVNSMTVVLDNLEAGFKTQDSSTCLWWKVYPYCCWKKKVDLAHN